MKVVCAWCGKDMGEKRGPKNKISHAMYPSCKEKYFGGEKENASPGPVCLGRQRQKTNQ